MAAVVVGHLISHEVHRHVREPGFGLHIMGVGLAGTSCLRYDDGQELISEPGYVAMIEPGVSFSLETQAGGRYEEYYAIFAAPPQWDAWLSWARRRQGVRTVKVVGTPAWEATLEAWREAFLMGQGRGPLRDKLTMNALEKVILIASTAMAGAGVGCSDARIAEVLDYISAHFAQPLDVPILARRSHLSPSRFAHLFSQEMGQSPMHYLEGVRMDRARDLLLASRAPINQIAGQVGFESPYHFSDRFRARMGKSPREYRRNPVSGPNDWL
jgi:AraC family transcriptional regulator, arabinose operon regulatory protein